MDRLKKYSGNELRDMDGTGRLALFFCVAAALLLAVLVWFAFFFVS